MPRYKVVVLFGALALILAYALIRVIVDGFQAIFRRSRRGPKH